MKKAFLFVAVAALAMGMASCGGSKSESGKTENTTAQEQTEGTTCENTEWTWDRYGLAFDAPQGFTQDGEATDGLFSLVNGEETFTLSMIDVNGPEQLGEAMGRLLVEGGVSESDLANLKEVQNPNGLVGLQLSMASGDQYVAYFAFMNPSNPKQAFLAGVDFTNNNNVASDVILNSLRFK